MPDNNTNFYTGMRMPFSPDAEQAVLGAVLLDRSSLDRAAEIRDALKAGARIIGVNNRNLKDFTVDARNSLTLREEVPEGILFVAESGIKSAEDVEALRRAGVDACLVGETLMRASDKKAKLLELKGGPRA